MIHAPTHDKRDVTVVGNTVNCPGYLAKNISKDTVQLAIRKGRVRSHIVSAETRLQGKNHTESGISPGR